MHRITDVVPDACASLDEFERFVHADIQKLTPVERWAERLVLEQTLAAAIFRAERPRFISAPGDGAPTTDRDWVVERIKRLKAAERRRAA